MTRSILKVFKSCFHSKSHSETWKQKPTALGKYLRWTSNSLSDLSSVKARMASDEK